MLDFKNFVNPNELVALHTNLDKSTRFIAGYLLACDKEDFVLAAISPQGQYDGYILKKNADVFKVQKEGKDIEKLNKLISHYKPTHPPIVLNDSSLITDLLSFAQKNAMVVSIELLNSGYDDIIGYVKSIDGGTCLVEGVSIYGETDGTAIALLRDITHIACDTDDEHDLGILYNLV